MRYLLCFTFCLVMFFFSCAESKPTKAALPRSDRYPSVENTPDLEVVFVSCNDQDREQPLWKSIAAHHPAVLIWGGDNIYADTENMEKMARDYQKVRRHPDYAALAAQTTVFGTWDDHDYGKNDAGKEWPHKEAAKQLLLEFLGYPSSDPLRSRPGVYHSRTHHVAEGSVKFIMLDTRSFRSDLKESEHPDKRYTAWPITHTGTILGEAQWQWLREELKDDAADFTVIVSSIQFLSADHGWEKWGNFPSEVERMNTLLESAKAQNVVILSGDRHMAEISVNPNAGLSYPLVDFTSSGLTHTWIDSATEANDFRVSNVVKQLNFGVLKFDFQKESILFEIRGENNFLYEQYLHEF